jgi:hypothetical protein
MLDEKVSSRKPYPLSWEEQSVLFAELPAHLQRMALFKVNTGCREQEVCKLRWGWEIYTSHYSGAELGHLIEAANMVSATDSRGPVLTILKRKQA